jgi:hypothetical protein
MVSKTSDDVAQNIGHVYFATDDSFVVQFAEDKTSMPFSHFKVLPPFHINLVKGQHFLI